MAQQYSDLRLVTSNTYNDSVGRNAYFVLRSESACLPASCVSCVTHAVVQTKWLTLPEFDAVGYQPKATPERGPWDGLAGIARPSAFVRLFQKLSVRNFGALGRCPSAEPALQRPRLEIAVRLGTRDF